MTDLKHNHHPESRAIGTVFYKLSFINFLLVPRHLPTCHELNSYNQLIMISHHWWQHWCRTV